MKKYYKVYIKRSIDLILSFLLILVLLPIFFLVSILIKLDSSGPILFKQKRLGENGKEFLIYKFRTMLNKNRKSENEIFLDNPEITKVGKYLRRFKIDELPQLYNVLIGKMSLVGPRPALVEQYSSLTSFAKKRLEVKPGLTGYAQINGNIYLPWEQRWQLDVYYVDNISFKLDLIIIFKTVLVLILGEHKFVKENKT